MPESINLTAAIQYVSEHGTILEQARMLRLLMGVEPSTEAYQKLVDSQNPDGGFPSRPKPGSRSAVDSTLTAIWQFDELGLQTLPAAQSALGFLHAMQKPDGGWDENPDLPQHDLPPWIQPGEASTRLYLTGYAAYWLGVLEGPTQPAFSRAVDYLAARQQPDGSIPGYMHNNWLSAAVFLLSGHGYAQHFTRLMDWLAARPWSAWADSQVGWALDCLLRAGLPCGHAFIQSALGELLRRQQPDGSWASEDGPAFAASATVGAIKACQLCGLVSGLD